MFYYEDDYLNHAQLHKDMVLSLSFCFSANFFFLFEFIWKNYAFGVRRTLQVNSFIVKLEWIILPIFIGYFIYFLVKHHEYR